MVEYAADSCSKGSKLFFVNKYGEILDLERGGKRCLMLRQRVRLSGSGLDKIEV